LDSGATAQCELYQLCHLEIILLNYLSEVGTGSWALMASLVEFLTIQDTTASKEGVC